MDNVRKTECIIFDCDGTLVDSEILGTQGLINVIHRYGAQLSMEECLSQYKGGKMNEVLASICHEKGLNVDIRQLEIQYRAELERLFKSDLKPVTGIPDILNDLQIPKCVASNGPVSKMQLTLSLTELSHHFDNKLFSAFDANAWKPDPALLAFAAKKMNVSLNNCILIEDSIPGVMAGINAGIPTFHYCADNHTPPVEHSLVTQFYDMYELPKLIKAID